MENIEENLINMIYWNKKMILKEIDILSPEITLFYNGSLSHSSRISGILTIIACAILVLCASYYFKDILNKS